MTGGQSETWFYFKNNTAQTVTLASNTGGFTQATKGVTINPDTPSVLGLAGQGTITAGACSAAAFTVSTNDGFGNASNVGENTTMTLSGAGAGSFYATAGCGAGTITNVTVSTGQSAANFYYKNNSVETVTLAAASGGFSSSTKVLAVNAAGVTVLALTGPSPLTAGTCSAIAYTVTTKDDFGNTANVGSDTGVTMSGGGAGAFYGTAGCGAGAISSVTVANGQSAATFYFKDNSAQSVTLAAQSGVLTSGSRAVVIDPASPTVLALAGASPLTAGTCSATAYTVTTKDAFGNVSNVGGTTSLTLSGAGAGSFYGTAGCGAGAVSSVSVTGGQSQATFYYKNDVAQAVTLASDSGGFSQSSVAVTVNAATPTVLALAGASPLTAGVCSATAYTVTTKDALGNVSNVGGNTNLTLSGAGAGSFTRRRDAVRAR